MQAAIKHAPADRLMDNDGDLIDSTLRGDHAAYAQLMSRYQDRLYASMLSVAHSAELTAEIVHVAFVQAFVKLNTFHRNAAFSTWLFSIAYNKFVSLKRVKRVRTLQRLDTDTKAILVLREKDKLLNKLVPTQSCFHRGDRHVTYGKSPR